MSNLTEPTPQLSPLKQAFLALEKMEARLEAAEKKNREPIALIGMGCRFPGGADSPEAFWELLREGRDAVGEVPADRWDIDVYFDPDPDAPGKISTRLGAFLTGIDQFDPQVFGIAPREANSMDPQQRLLLEVSWHALENAGIAPDSLNGSKTGVFVGITNSDYRLLQFKQGEMDTIDAYHSSGIALSIASGRISYVLGLKGPSISVDTACSSSLVAVHLAVQNLRAGECRMALAGGVNLMLIPETAVALTKYHMLAPDGRCKAFDARGDGFGRGEGCGMVVLKRLSDALADGDPIIAVIRGSAANQDGASSGLTAPNGPSQEAVVRSALENGGVRPAEVWYVETHGTGTSLGDPIEAQALGTVLREGRSPDQPVLLGSVKTNIGHLEGSAGIASLIKAALVIQHREIPPILHLQEPNPLIPWGQLPLSIPTQITPLAEGRQPLVGVSAFGFSGTNVHVLMGPAPEMPAAAPQTARSHHLLTLSAQAEPALKALAQYYESALSEQPELDIEDVCYTASTGRAALPHRLTLRAASMEGLRNGLAAFTNEQEFPGLSAQPIPSVDPPRVAFIFTGQGAQYVGMGRKLYNTQPVFRAALDACAELLKRYLDQPLLEVMFEKPGEESPLDDTTYTQPALFAVEYALARLWQSWGIQPGLVMGHSIGEYVAACLAGVFSLEDALKLVAARGRLMGALPPGGTMAAVLAGEERVRAALAPYAASVSLAAVNGPSSVVISGSAADVQAVQAALQADGIKTRALNVSHAFHSPLMQPMLDEFERVASEVRYSPPRIRLISDVTGRVATEAEVCHPAYWRQHAAAAVRFAASVETLYQQGVEVFLEIGPGTTLTGMGRLCLPDNAQTVWLNSLNPKLDDEQQMLDSLAVLYLNNASIDWKSLYHDSPHRKVRLPQYPFQHKRYWVEIKPGRARSAAHPAGSHPLLGARLRSPLKTVQFENFLAARDFCFLRDHQVFNESVMPGTGYLELGLAAAREVFGQPGAAVKEMVIHQRLTLGAEETRAASLSVSMEDDGEAAFQYHTADEAGETWTLHASGRLSQLTGALPAALDIDDIQRRCTEQIQQDAHYEYLSENGLPFGESMRGVQAIWRRDGEALGKIERTPAVAAESTRYLLHPALLDAHLQILAAALPGTPGVYLPFSIDHYQVYRPEVTPCWSYVQVSSGASGETASGDILLLDETGQVTAEVKGIHLKRALAENPRLKQLARYHNWVYEVQWEAAARQSVQVSPESTLSPNVDLHNLAENLPDELEELEAANSLSSYALDVAPQLDRISLGYILRALKKLGWQPAKGQHFSLNSLAADLKIARHNLRLLNRMIEMLTEDGLVKPTLDGWEIVTLPEALDPSAMSARLRAAQPRYQAEIDITTRCGEQLAEALAGTADPLQLLFPGGDFSVTESMYYSSPSSRTYNGLAAAAVQKLVAQWPAGKPLRVLEIGGGSGGTTNSLLPLLPAGQTDYLFTDISPLFAARAKEKFGHYAFMRFAALDLEKDPAAQDLPGTQFDLVIAANVIHATADLRSTLGHVRGLMAPGGLLLMLEVTGPERWVDITFGLTDGWWRFTDTDVRPTYPLLSGTNWTALLKECGFSEALAIPEEDGTGFVDEAMILAQADLEATEGSQGVRWLVLADRGGAGARLSGMLAERGQEAVLVYPGPHFEACPDGTYLANPLRIEDFTRLLNETGGPYHHLLHLWSLDGDGDLEEPGALDGALEQVTASALHLVQAAAASGDAGQRLWLVTRGAQPVGKVLPGTASVSGATLWGLGKVIALEHPELRTVRIDLDPDRSSDAALALFEEISQPDENDQIALRYESGSMRDHGDRFAARLSPYSLKPAQAETEPRKVGVTQRGSLNNLTLEPLVRRSPAPGEVEIRVHAASLNFKDVLNALDMVPGAAAPLGSECAGEITAVGEGVSGLAVGDAVVAVAAGSLADFAYAPAELVLPKPAALSFAEAASLPIAFITADFCLRRVAHLQPGERVLIHAASGGVGLAAVQIAQRAGAEIFATAGSPRKRAYLSALGIQHVMDSRTIDFAAEIMALTGGAGVDVVLNSLAGESIAKSLSVLAENGRFVEIGKSGLLTPQQAAALGKGRSYTIVDWTENARQEPALIRSIFSTILDDLAAGVYHPLPLHGFAMNEVADAFRFMAQARHIGKIVVTQPAAESEFLEHLRPDATYLITGGLRGLGLLAAEWMVEKGARSLVLAGRSAPSEQALAAIRVMEESGARVISIQVDISDPAGVDRLMNEINDKLPPLRGVIHSAGVLDDGVLMRQDWQRFQNVLGPKARGSWLLHQATQHIPLDFFVLFSSVAAVFGSPGQGNHAAANAFMDMLAHYRRSQGLPALSINWGAWSEVGIAAQKSVDTRSAAQGMLSIEPKDGLFLLERMLQAGPAQLAVSPMKWPSFLKQFGSSSRMFFGRVAQIGESSTVSTAASPAETAQAAPNFAEVLMQAPPARQHLMLAEFVKARAAKVLGMDSQSIQDRTPLSELGLDSLMAVELRTQLSEGLKLKRSLPATLAFDYPTIEAITEYIARDVLELKAASPARPVPAEPRPASALEDIEDLSDEEVDRLLAQRKSGQRE